jgi:nitroimidazol reductase NimA-like FMN-containing flavoprotein (pyridoxamine 5'-phosphate oxidase superfamily)
MVVHVLTFEECKAVLARSLVGRLACARDGQPYIVPIFLWFDDESNCLYGFSTVGRKVEWMRRNPKVCVEVDEIADPLHWTTVLVTGRYDEIGDEHEADELRKRAQSLVEQRKSWWLPATANLSDGQERERAVLYRIHIVALSGRRTTRPTGGDQQSAIRDEQERS